MAESKQLVALVTGANKGIGFAIVQALLANKQPALTTVLLGSRDVARGEAAVKQIGDARCKLVVMDVNDAKSVQSAAQQIQKTYGGLDILINNAGMAWKGDAFNEEVARTTITTNYYGVLNCLDAFLPLVRADGRVVNVSSMVSQSALSRCSAELQQQFLKPDLKLSELSALIEKFVDDVKNDRWQQAGWPKTTYGISKVGCTQLTRVLAPTIKTPGVLMNSCCPGWVRTDMAGPNADLSPAEGAETPVHLCFLPAGSPNGVFWRHKAVAPYLPPPAAPAAAPAVAPAASAGTK
jgi:carbonyl reductase 1